MTWSRGEGQVGNREEESTRENKGQTRDGTHNPEGWGARGGGWCGQIVKEVTQYHNQPQLPLLPQGHTAPFTSVANEGLEDATQATHRSVFETKSRLIDWP